MQKQVRFNKLTAWLLTLAMLFTTLPGFTLTAFAEDNDNLCAHHAEHTADCGYVEGVTGVECTHTHDDTCGYAEAVEGVDCTCEDTDENGAIIHTEGCGYVAPVDDVTCSHVHDSECGYVEAVEASPCTYECALCGLTEITAWSWIDEWEMIDPDTGVLALPGASADNPAYFDDIVSMLPVEITATVDGGEETITLNDWSCPGYPEEGAYSGNYIFTAALPEGYTLAEDAPELTVTVELGGAALFATDVTKYGLTISGGTEGTDFTYDHEFRASDGGMVSLSTYQRVLTILKDTDLTISGEGWDSATLTAKNIPTDYGEVVYIPSGVTANLTLDEATIYGGRYTPSITVDGTLNLTLKGENKLDPYFDGRPGIWVLEDGNLIITEESTGNLKIIVDGSGAAIGQDNSAASAGFDDGGVNKAGNITINGGTLNLSAGSGAAIGSAHGSNFTSITINGGVINAASSEGAAIGTGFNNSATSQGTVKITGGTINASGGTTTVGSTIYKSDGVGSSDEPLTGGVTITGGSVKNTALINRPTDGTNDLYLATIALDGDSGGTAVSAVKYYLNGTEKSYSVSNMQTMEGKLYLWLPEGAVVSSVTAGGSSYTGNLLVQDDDSAEGTFYTGDTNTVSLANSYSNVSVSLPYGNQFAAGATAYVQVDAADGYAVTGVGHAENPDSYTLVDGNIYSFTMPSSAAMVYVTTQQVALPDTLDLSYGDITFGYDADKNCRYLTYYTSDGTTKTVNYIPAGQTYTITQSNSSAESTANTIKVENWDKFTGDELPLKLTISNLNINADTGAEGSESLSENLIAINSSTVELTLVGTSTLTSSVTTAANREVALLGVDGTSELTITQGSNGSLTSTAAGGRGAAIGGDCVGDTGDGVACGIINIKGGTIAAVIGDEEDGRVGYGAAIGSGRIGTGGTVNISGGEVTATSHGAGAAIGSGTLGTAFTVNVSGGKVIARNTYGSSGGGAAIGSGSNGAAYVIISGGEVEATAFRGAAIGSGDSGDATVAISDGTVIAHAAGSYAYGAGMGSGAYGEATVTISGGSITASTGGTSGTYAAAIGGGGSGNSSTSNATVTITGGDINATGSSYTPAIGSGYSGSSNANATVSISGGNINVDNDTVATIGLGGGNNSTATVTITGGSVNGKKRTTTTSFTDGNNNEVYLITADLSDTVGDSTAVTGATITNPNTVTYGFDDVKTNASGILYLWLPAKATDAELGGVIYSGTPNTDNNAIFTRAVKLNEVQASSVTDTTATITASVDPYAKVYYLTSIESFTNGTALANATGAKSVTADSTGTVTINVTGLTPSTTYKYYLTSKLGTSYSSVESVDVTTEKPNLAGAMVTFSPESSTYTRKAQFPTVTVTWNGQALTDGSDYYVTWTDEKGATVPELKNAGTYTATINGVQGYIGEVTKTFTINKATPVITWANKSWMIVYTGSAANIVALLTLQDGEKGELTYSYYNNDNPDVSGNGLPSQVGDYTITASYAATDNYEAAQETTQLKIDPADISEAEVTVSGTFAYTGIAQTPAPVVELYGNTLKMDADYTVSYTNNTNAGTATVTVTGKGNCTGEATATFTINQKQTAVTAPVNKTLDIIPSEVSDVTALLPSTVTTNDGDFTITWSCDSLDTTPNGTSTFKWTITDEKFSNYTADKTSDTIIVTNGNAIAVNHTGTDKETTYGKNTYDVSQMFTIDENAGTASYSATGITGACTISGSALTITKAGTIEIKLTTEAKGNYAAGEATATLTVAKGTGEGSVTMAGWTYGGTASNPVAQSETNGTENVSYQYKVKDAADSTYSASKPTNAGNYTVKATFAGTDLYNELVKTADFTIAKAQAVITVDTAPIVKTYGDTWELPTATATFGRPVADKTVSEMVNAGTYTVTYSVEETDNWLGAEKTISVTINPKKIEKPAADTTEFVYDGNEKTYSVAASDYYTVTGNKMTDAGSQDVIVALNDKENYTWNNGETADEKFTFSIAPKPITAATVGAFAELTYTGEAQIPDAPVTIDGLTVTGTWSKVTNVADKTTFTADGNFTGTIADKETGMTAADMSAGITASGYNGTYDGEGHTITVSLSGVAEGATVKYGTTEGTYDLDAAPSYTDSVSATVFYQVTKTNCGTVTGSATVEIAKKKIDIAIVLTAPVKNETPQTEITGTGYTATVVWSPEVTDKFGYNTEYTATVTITTDGNHTVEGIAANGYTVEGAKTVTNEENSNVITVAYEKTGSRPSSGGGSSSNTTTTTTKNDDGSTTKTTTNKTTGTTTEVTTGTDGSTTTVETKKDGTVTTTEKDKDGNTTTTVENPDGSSTTTEKNKDGSETVVEKDTDGTTTTTEKDSEGNKTVTTEKADGTTTTEETKKDGTTVKTETTASGETTAEVEAKGETEVVIPVDNADEVTKVVVTDKDGNETEVEFEVKDGGIAISVSGDSTVSVQTGHICYAKDFTDVDPDAWYHLNIDYVLENGLFKGTTETTFAPNDNLTRAMLVTVLYRAEGEPATNRSIPFADVDMGSYYANAVIWAQQNGIVKGVSETEFAPNDNITREQIAAILYRYAIYKGMDAVDLSENLSFTDADDISEYAISALNWAVGTGLIKGYEDNTVRPLNNATRAEAAALLERFIKAN